MRLPPAPLLLATLLGASPGPETRFVVALPAGIGDARGRLLLFAEPATPANATEAEVDTDAADAHGVFVAARDVSAFGPAHAVVLDAAARSFPLRFTALPPGDYRVQAVLDRNGDYNYSGRGAGDLVSRVVSIRFPLATIPSIKLDHALPPEPDQFDVTGLPPRAAEQITASRPHLHDEHVASPALTRFRGTGQTVAAWVLTPPGYDAAARRTYPTVFTAGGFGGSHKLDGQQLSQIWHLMEDGTIPPMIWVALDYHERTGATEFADSANNGPWDEALIHDVIPALEARYRMDAKPTGRFLTGHSSGGWFALWTMVNHPGLFGGSWPTSPDPSDFHEFVGVDIYASGANMYRDAQGRPRPFQRDDGKVLATIETVARGETVLGDGGGQLQSFERVFSPRRADGTPAPLFDRTSGAIDPAVATYWRDRYDVAHRIETEWPRLRRQLDGKVHLTVGAIDSYYLDGPARRLEAAFRKVGGRADFTFVPGATHAVSQVYARGGDRLALWKSMTAAMHAIARPGENISPQGPHPSSPG